MWDGWPSWNVTGGNPCGKWKIPDGTYDWQKVTTQTFTPPTVGQDTKKASPIFRCIDWIYCQH